MDELSPTEWQIYRLLARGRSLRQIATTRCISMNTIRTHMKHILGKLGVERQAEAIVMYYNSFDGVRLDILEDLEKLRKQNPMNGDGSNYMLDQALARVANTPELERHLGRLKVEHRAQWDEEARRIQEEYQPKRREA